MTNTIYFEPYRSDESVSTSSEGSEQANTAREESHASSLPLYSLIYRAFSGCVSLSSGLKSRDCGLDDNEFVSSKKLELRNLKEFNFEELKTATRNFHPDVFLGEGGFGRVYKAYVDENTLTVTKPGTGIAVAIKSLNIEGLQGHKEWLAELYFLGRFPHPNLVKLWGYSLQKKNRLLVYEFMPLGSLAHNLFRRGSSSLLSWSLRMKVALGAAKGLAFLHRDDINVLYRDFKSSNILLDSNYNPKLSDFGLAMLGPTNGRSCVSTRVMGTYGYSAPEYISTGHLTARCDVYSFGVVLLEILSGRQVIDHNQPSGEKNLVKWAKPRLKTKGKMSCILDSSLDGCYPWESARKAAKLALRCVSTVPKYRPKMNEVVTILEQLQDSNYDAND